jgi:transposase-like protein
MVKRTRRTHSPKLKAKVALEAIVGDKTLVELAQKHNVHPNQITDWKRQLIEHAADVFSGEPNTPPVDLKTLHAKIGQLALENDFLEGALSKAGLLSANK